jgi:ketosteroid isomerase-like protein
MKIVRNAVIGSALAAVAAAGIVFANAGVGVAHPPAPRAASDAVNVVLAYGQALDADDLAGVQQVYAPDAVVAPPGQPVKKGAAEVSQFYAGLFAIADVQITFTIESVHVDRGLAYVTSHSNGVLKFKDGSPDSAGIGRELFVLRNTNGQWKIVAYWFNN